MGEYISGQAHIIPFDLGSVFWDELALDNTKNINKTIKFYDELKKWSESKNYIIEKGFTISNIFDGAKSYEFLDSISEARRCICKITIIEKKLYCYILASGTGMFVLYDINDEFNVIKVSLSKSSIDPILKAVRQKNSIQNVILGSECNNDGLISIKNIMLEFRKKCWSILQEIKFESLRKFSANENYKSAGLSYVLTIYLCLDKKLSDDQIERLLYIPFKYNDDNDLKLKSKYETLNYPKNSVKTYKGDIYFSWSAVAFVSNDNMTFEELLQNGAYIDLLKNEIYAQSRWFIADNSLDNIKGRNYSLEKLERIGGVINLTKAELANETSANMSQMYKDIRMNVIKTSEIIPLYDSILQQINVQKKLKEAKNEANKNKSRLFVDSLMALFTAATLYGTIIKVIDSEYTTRDGILFAISIIIAVGVCVFNYLNNKRRR